MHVITHQKFLLFLINYSHVPLKILDTSPLDQFYKYFLSVHYLSFHSFKCLSKNALVLVAAVTNWCHKIDGLKHQKFILSQSEDKKFISFIEIQVSSRPWYFWKFWGKNYLPASRGCWHSFVTGPLQSLPPSSFHLFLFLCLIYLCPFL